MNLLTFALDVLIWGVIAIVAIAHAFNLRTAPPRGNHDHTTHEED